MAKELPYFKFEPNAWDTGNIQMCSRESKGLFADLCSLYWSRLGELPYALALQKLCNGNNDAFQELRKHDIFGVIEDQIVIDFLDEQLLELNQISEKRRKAAQKRWGDASALQMQSKSNAKRREEKREEEKKITRDDFFKDGSDAFEEIKSDELMVERLIRTVHHSGFKAATAVQVITAVRYFLTKESAKPEFFYRPRDEIKSHLVNWIAQNATKITTYG